MSRLRIEGYRQDEQGQEPTTGDGVGGQGVSLPWLRHALSDGPDTGAGGDGTGRAAAEAPATEAGDPFWVFVRQDFERINRGRRKPMTWEAYRKRYGILGGREWRLIKRWERQQVGEIMDLEKETDCD